MAIITFIISDVDADSVDVKVQSNTALPSNPADYTAAQQCAVVLREIIEMNMGGADEEKAQPDSEDNKEASSENQTVKETVQ